MAPIFRALGLSAAAALAACSANTPMETLNCAPFDVIADGSQLAGIEDLAALDKNTLILSAYNRREFRKTARGLFTLDLMQTDRPFVAERITPVNDPLVPHGFAFDAGNAHLYVIDRSDKAAAQIKRYDLQIDGTARLAKTLLSKDDWSSTAPYPCNLNDVTVLTDGNLLATNDRKSCSRLGKAIDNLFGRANGSLWRITQNGTASVSKDGLYFPNGAASGNSGGAVITETRAKIVRRVNTAQVFIVPGAPDNISKSSGGPGHWVAVIPSLWQYALHRAGAPNTLSHSIISHVTNEVKSYKTPNYIGATSAVFLGGSVFLSGAYSDGMARCKAPAHD